MIGVSNQDETRHTNNLIASISQLNHILTALMPPASLTVSLVMNYLAHAFLSFEQPDVLAGNMTSDFIKGKVHYDYTGNYFSGIRLHRFIDAFTDAHPINLEVKSIFKTHYGLYAGAFLDIAYDYFVANDTDNFQDQEALAVFVQETYNRLNQQTQPFPEAFQPVFSYMQAQNWLLNYREKRGIEKSFAGLARRAKYITESATAYQLFNDHQEELGEAYASFFPQLKIAAFQAYTQLIHND